jgi:hypothetical protein
MNTLRCAPVQIQYAPSHSRGLNCGASLCAPLQPKKMANCHAEIHDAACFEMPHTQTKYYLEQGAQLYLCRTCKEKQRNCNFCVRGERAGAAFERRVYMSRIITSTYERTATHTYAVSRNHRLFAARQKTYRFSVAHEICSQSALFRLIGPITHRSARLKGARQMVANFEIFSALAPRERDTKIFLCCSRRI